jgi:hypothetical protein
MRFHSSAGKQIFFRRSDPVGTSVLQIVVFSSTTRVAATARDSGISGPGAVHAAIPKKIAPSKYCRFISQSSATADERLLYKTRSNPGTGAAPHDPGGICRVESGFEAESAAPIFEHYFLPLFAKKHSFACPAA